VLVQYKRNTTFLLEVCILPVPFTSFIGEVVLILVGGSKLLNPGMVSCSILE
jgi:hypothetical protein